MNNTKMMYGYLWQKLTDRWSERLEKEMENHKNAGFTVEVFDMSANNKAITRYVRGARLGYLMQDMGWMTDETGKVVMDLVYNHTWNKLIQESGIHALFETFTFVRDVNGKWYVSYDGNLPGLHKIGIVDYWRGAYEDERQKDQLWTTYYYTPKGTGGYMAKGYKAFNLLTVFSERKRVKVNKGLVVGDSWQNPYDENRTEWIKDYIKCK